jgi:hypothetical protein
MQEPRAGRLAERTVDDGLAVMEYCESLPRTAAGRHVGDQLLRSESKELLLMVGKSINTASARMQGKIIGA